MGNCLTECCNRDQSKRDIITMQGKHTSSVAAAPHLPILMQVEANGLQKRKPNNHYNISQSIHPYLWVTSSKDANHIMYQSYKRGSHKNDIKWVFKIELSDDDREEMTLNFYVFHNSECGQQKNFLIGKALNVKLRKDFTYDLIQNTNSGITRVNGSITIKDMDYFVKPPLNIPTSYLFHPTTFVMKFKADIDRKRCPYFFRPVLKVFGPWKKDSGESDFGLYELAATEMDNVAEANWEMIKINLPREYDGSFLREFKKMKLLLKVYQNSSFNKESSPFASQVVSIEELFFREDYTKEFQLLGDAYKHELKGTLILEELGLLMPVDS